MSVTTPPPVSLSRSNLPIYLSLSLQEVSPNPGSTIVSLHEPDPAAIAPPAEWAAAAAVVGATGHGDGSTKKGCAFGCFDEPTAESPAMLCIRPENEHSTTLDSHM